MSLPLSGKGGNTHCGVRRRQKKEKKNIIIFSNRIRRFHPSPRECSQWHRGNYGKEESKLWIRFDTVPSSAGLVLLFSDMICQSERLMDGLCPKPDRRGHSTAIWMLLHAKLCTCIAYRHHRPLGTYAHSA